MGTMTTGLDTFLLAETSIERESSFNKNEINNVNQPLCDSNLELNEKKEVSSRIFNFPLSDIVWRNVIAFLYLHLAALYAIYLLAFGHAKFSTFFVGFVYGTLGGFGVTAGAHRLWAHRAYKAKWPLRLILVICNTIAFQNSVYEWVRDHRVHHKYTDSDADPHNVKRGFFFAHMGWLLIKKHPDVKNKGRSVDMTDLEEDVFVMFQKNHYLKIMPIVSFILPTALTMWITGETLSYSFYVGAVLRYVVSLHSTWLVNSAAHIWGMKPYDKNIKSSNNIFVAFVAYGEGWHNYHHVFPWDYKTAELGDYMLNVTTGFIDFFAKIGYAYGGLGGFSLTAGAHRLWSHRSYKAKWQLKLFYIICNFIAFEHSIYDWVRDHRVHHKYTDTNADPHNANRGIFFAHMGWLMLRKHPEVKLKGRLIDMNDLEEDKLIMFQKKYYYHLLPIMFIIVPTIFLPMVTGDTISNCIFIGTFLRYFIQLHSTWSVNSLAHFYGMKPYDSSIKSTNNLLVSIIAFGEGWHNYHHVFPWDYKTSELGFYKYNLTTGFIDMFAKIGWAYDLKTVSKEMIYNRKARTGEDAKKHKNNSSINKNQLNLNENLVWGWDDPNMSDKDKINALILNKIN